MSTTSSRYHASRHYVAGVGIPLAWIGAVYALFWTSDRLVRVGPLDRATFGWLVVVPLSVLAPLVAGLAWRRFDPVSTRTLASVVGSVVAIVVAVLVWQAVAFPGCETAPLRTPQDVVLPSLLVGAFVGLGIAWSGSVSARVARHGSMADTAAVGVFLGVVLVTAGIVVAAAVLFAPACQRPIV